MYLLYTTSFVTLEEVKNYKSLQSYKYFTAGWVVEHKWELFPDCCLVIGKVNHSYAISASPLQTWIIVNTSGAIACGHCTCMAGLSETCSHVRALLYWMEYKVRTQEAVLQAQIHGWSQRQLGRSHILSYVTLILHLLKRQRKMPLWHPYRAGITSSRGNNHI